MVEWYWQGKTEVLGEKHYTACVVDEWMSMEQWWNDTDRGKLKYWEKNIIQRGWDMNEWVWSNGGMILTGENWSTGRKTLYSVGGRWMNEYGVMVEWYWQGKTVLIRPNLFPVSHNEPQIERLQTFNFYNTKSLLIICDHFLFLSAITRICPKVGRYGIYGGPSDMGKYNFTFSY